MFELAEVANFPQLQVILTLCREKTSLQAIHHKLKIEFNLREGTILKILEQMVNLQLLLTERSVNITGEDYFKRLNVTHIKSTASYIIAERKSITGGINNDELTEVRETINFMAKHLPTIENRHLKKFREAFLKKFEHRVISLMTAMDLETGIGYGDLGGHETEYLLADWFNLQDQNKKKELQIPYTELHRFLLDQLMTGAPIRLDEFISDELVPAPSLPNTLSVLFHFWQGNPVIENMGGCTANALLGRFTIASRELEEFGRQITAIEENANPDILFFDVAYQVEKEVDNVNRRKQLYQFELPILTWSCSSEPLDFDDILVTVRDFKIILWSKKYRKRMIPRIPSAYNYNRSDLAVFRFLCDLQHQEVKSDLNFKLSYLFPNLSRYPRVSYKDVIVSPATWLLPNELLKTALSEGVEKGKRLFRQWLEHAGVHFPFKTGHSDQTLCFDSNNDDDVSAFLSYCRQQGHHTIYISEALISDYKVLTGSPAKKHSAQFIISYSHENRVYSTYELQLPKENNHTVRIVSPGKDWLYFEIYCHTGRANSILSDQINNLLTAIKDKIRKWFFIRYEEPEPHIRLRVQLNHVSEGYLVITQFQALLNIDIENSLISDLQIKTYFREIDRYGSDRIELVEQVFFQDSKYILGLLVAKKSANTLYVLTLSMMQCIMAMALTDVNDQINFAKNMADSFSQELNMRPQKFKLLNQRFESLKNELNLNINYSTITLPARLHDAYNKVFSTSKEVDDRRHLLADMLHMHINRLFNSNQRAHEGILYQFLVKLLMIRNSRSSSPLAFKTALK